MSNIRHALILAALALLGVGLAVSFTACSTGQLTAFVTGKTSSHPNVWVIQADTSGSTASQAVRGGTYEHEIMPALGQAAREGATVYAGAVDGNAVANSTWQIAGVPLLSDAGGGNARLAEAVRVRKAKGLRGQVQQLLATHPTSGTDLMGGLQDVARLGRTLPKGTTKTLVLLTDGALNLSRFGGYDVYTDPPDTEAQRKVLVARLQREGELPNLTGWRVYLGGIGVGIGDRRTARAVVRLWEILIPATGARLVASEPTLSFG
jgi:hypothetical protein